MTDERGHLRLPTPEVREQLHHMPVGYTAAAGADERARLRLVGNGWHWGVASRMLSLLVVAASIGSVSAAPSAGTLRCTTLQWLASQRWGSTWDMTPPPRARDVEIDELESEEDHCMAAVPQLAAPGGGHSDAGAGLRVGPANGDEVATRPRAHPTGGHPGDRRHGRGLY